MPPTHLPDVSVDRDCIGGIQREEGHTISDFGAHSAELSQGLPHLFRGLPTQLQQISLSAVVSQRLHACRAEREPTHGGSVLDGMPYVRAQGKSSQLVANTHVNLNMYLSGLYNKLSPTTHRGTSTNE